MSNEDVKEQHPQYKKNVDRWVKVDKVIDSDVEGFLRNVGKNEKETKRVERQKEYADGAILDNFTLKTLSGLTGTVFMKPPTIEMQTNLEYLVDDVDGAGTTLEQQSKEAVDQCIRKGRYGLFVDMPKNESGQAVSIADNESGKILPRISRYYAGSIINWNYRKFGSVRLLDLVVLAESRSSATSIYSHEQEEVYRVLALDKDGFYYQFEIDSEFNATNPIYPLENGNRMRAIPFYFIGSISNTADVDPSPLFPIATLNIGHYRNSADTEENSFVCSQAMLIIALSAEMNATDFNRDNPDGVQVGSRRGLNVGAGGSAEFIQAEPSDKAQSLMVMKKEQAVQLGAQIITPSQQITAESARIQQSVNTSILATISKNTTSAYSKGLEQCSRFLGTEYASEFKLNQDFHLTIMTAQDRAQWTAEIMQGISPKTLYYKKLRESGDFPDDWTDDMIDEKVQAQGLF